MRIPMNSNVLIITMACVIVAWLMFSLTPRVSAQNPHGTFNELLRPYVNQQVTVGEYARNVNRPTTLKEVGFDYIMIDTPQGETQAIPLSSIQSLTLGGQYPAIYVNRN